MEVERFLRIFSANLVPGFEQLLDHKRMEKLDQRTVLSVADYERLFYEEVDLDPSGNQCLSLLRIKLLL